LRRIGASLSNAAFPTDESWPPEALAKAIAANWLFRQRFSPQSAFKSFGESQPWRQEFALPETTRRCCIAAYPCGNAARPAQIAPASPCKI